MDILNTIKDLNAKLGAYRSENKSIGLVPTMGALHAGHMSLVKKCLAENDCCVVSVFVNPTQFNNPDDLKNYPRVPERDAKLLTDLGVTIMFLPSVEEIYPEPDNRIFDFGQLDKVMEGAFRPGHFNGVAQIVSRLFDIVKPDRAYFGEKDFQQLAIIKQMVKQLNLSVQIKPMPIIREASGLALSSRNELLTPAQKELAVNISKTLAESKEQIKTKDITSTIDYVINKLNNLGLEVEYFQIVDADSLMPVNNWSDSEFIVGCIAVYCGKVRLIDNIFYKNN